MENATQTREKIISILTNFLSEQHAIETLKQCESFLEFMLKENEKFNLTAIRDYDEALARHILDSLIPLWVYPELFRGQKMIADIGSGAGFPGIPLAFALPETKIFMIESVGKKSGFIKIAKEKFDISNSEVISERAETAARDVKYREKFDIALTRALGSLPVIIELSLPFLKLHGKSIAYKGKSAADEITKSERALEMLGGKIEDIKNYSEINSMDLNLVLIEKLTATDKKYPRIAGTPNKSPIL